MTSDTVSRLTLLKADATDVELIRLGDIERRSGFRTGTRFSLQGKTTYEVTVDLQTEIFYVTQEGNLPIPLTKDLFDKTSSLCYWPR
ncbi:hypothetical protein G6L37_07460 [Agrobacterium rubi]|nr:hypothetical protein [Agrobacterium rubi]NTF25205.1 hypothetical protein [Agrobacterium rubi]